MALGIEISQITPLFPNKIFLQWNLIDPTESGTYTFRVERSGSTNGPWEIIGNGLQNNYNYIDDLLEQPSLTDSGKLNLHALQRAVYYQVTVIPPSGCVNGATSSPRTIGDINVSPVAAGLRRRLRHDEEILFKRLNGTRLIILKQRFWGTRCPDCYDAITRASTQEHCATCYGTSFVGGYWNPIMTWGRINTPLNTQEQITSRNEHETAPQVITLLDVPLLQDKDIIVEVETNNRHVVRRQVQTELRRKSVHQQINTSLLARDSVVYEIPADPRTTPALY